MKILKIILQVAGILLLIPAVAMATLSFGNRNNDGPSIIFPGDELVSGDLYTGPEPDWGGKRSEGCKSSPPFARQVQGGRILSCDGLRHHLGRAALRGGNPAERPEFRCSAALAGASTCKMDRTRLSRQFRAETRGDAKPGVPDSSIGCRPHLIVQHQGVVVMRRPFCCDDHRGNILSVPNRPKTGVKCQSEQNGGQLNPRQAVFQ